MIPLGLCDGLTVDTEQGTGSVGAVAVDIPSNRCLLCSNCPTDHYRHFALKRPVHSSQNRLDIGTVGEKKVGRPQGIIIVFNADGAIVG